MKFSNKEINRFMQWIDNETVECYKNCNMNCPAYISGDYGSVCALQTTYEYLAAFECLQKRDEKTFNSAKNSDTNG